MTFVQLNKLFASFYLVLAKEKSVLCMGWHLLSWFVLLLFVQNGGESVWQRKELNLVLTSHSTNPRLAKGKVRAGQGSWLFLNSIQEAASLRCGLTGRHRPFPAAIVC